MKTFLALLLVTFASAAFAQSAPPQTVTAPGCGPDNTKFDVTSDKSKHPFAQPDPGKALIYFLQDDSSFESRPRPTTRFGLNGKWIGATQANSYFYVSVDPGEHHLCAEWQNFVGFTSGPKSGAAHFTAEAGRAYFYVVNDQYIREHGPAGMKMELLDSDQGQLMLSKFAFSRSQPKK
jgi:hypothetical protein